MGNIGDKRYDLEERTLAFSKKLITFLNKLPKSTINRRLVDQCVRSGTSVGANYREANETQTKNDFAYRVRICRKESKETSYWLELIAHNNLSLETETSVFAGECLEFIKIFTTILINSK